MSRRWEAVGALFSKSRRYARAREIRDISVPIGILSAEAAS
jgi:hypothetical protein